MATGLVAAAPILVAVGRAISFGWTATADDGQIAVRAFDVLSAHPPLLGQISLTSQLARDPTFNLGPMEYWLLAIPARLGSPALLVAMGLVNTACVLGSVALARRRGGFGLMFAVAVAIAVTLRSLPANALYDILNPYAALLLFTLLLFLAWSIACGDAFLLPLAVAAASFTVQCHLTYVLPVLGALAVAGSGLVVARRSARRRTGETDRGVRWWLVATGVVAVVCWTCPIAEQLTHDPGNLVLVSRAARADRVILGRDAGWHATVRTVGVAPWWLREARPPFLRLVDLVGRPSAAAIASTVLVVGGAAVIALLAVRRRRHDILCAAALSLWLCGSVALVARSVPLDKNTIGLMQYVITWASPAGMWVWVTLGWSVAVLARAHRLQARFRGSIAAPAPLVLVAAAAVWAVADRGPERTGGYFKDIGPTAALVSRVIPDRDTVYMNAPPSFTALDFGPATIYALRRDGNRVMVPRDVAIRWGSRYRPIPAAFDKVVRIHEAGAVPAGSGRVIARLPGRVTITLARAHGP